jgi:transcription elongation factor GreA
VSEEPWLGDWDVAVARGDNAAIEEVWLARLEGGVDDAASFVEALRRLRSAGKKTLAATLLELGEIEATSRRAWRTRAVFLRELLRLGIGDASQQRLDLEQCVRELWPGRPSLDPLLAHFSIASARHPADAFDAIETWLAYDIGTVVAMAARGPGRVAEANPKLGVLRVDFEREKRVPVPIDAASRFLTLLPERHFLRRRLEEPDAVRRELREDPAAAVETILGSLGGPLTVSEVKAALEGLLGPDEWTSWWARARKNPRLLGSGSGARLSYRLASAEGRVAIEAELRSEFEAAPLAGRIELARRHAARSTDLLGFMVEGLVNGAADAAAGQAWEALALAERLAGGEAVAAARGALLRRVGADRLVASAGDAQQRIAALDFVRSERPSEWAELTVAHLAKEDHPRVLSAAAATLLDAGEEARVDAFLDQVLLQPLRYPAALVWACEDDAEGSLGERLAARRNGALLVRLLELAERDELFPFRSRLKVVLSAGGMAGRILADRLTPDQARRLTQILERPGELGEARAWLRRALPVRFPELREEPADVGLPLLPATLERLRDELRELLEKQIPATLRAIQVAREHGDLRENFEYHAARARQELLSARAATLQTDLGRVRLIDLATVDARVVRVGTTVTLRSAAGEEMRRVTILGPYEADAERGVLSHESDAAKALLDRPPGAAVDFGGRAWVVDSIRAAQERDRSSSQ